MQPKIAPTSPKYALENKSVLEKVWKENTIQPPARIPLLSLMLWALAFSLVGIILVLGGLFWYLRSFPSSRLKDFLPSTVTTVIENSSNSSSLEPPSLVRQLTDTTVPLVVSPAVEGLTTDAQVVGTAAALSSGGWLVTLDSALASNSNISAVSSQRTILNVTRQVRDPASPFVYLKTAATTLQAVDFATQDKIKPGQTAWVIVRRLNSSVALRRQLIPAAQDWQTCDQYGPTWVLDEPVVAPMGTPVVTDNGQLIGLLGGSNYIWSVDLIEPVLKNVFDEKSIERPSCGFTYIPANTVAAAKSRADGMIIGAANGNVAIKPGGAAEKAGLKAGDIITAADGIAVTDWVSVWRAAHPGQSIELTIMRGATEKKLTLTLGLYRP